MKRSIFLCALLAEFGFCNIDWTLSDGQADFHILHQFQGTASSAMGFSGAAFSTPADAPSSPLISDTTKGLIVNLSRQYLPAQIDGQTTLGHVSYQAAHYGIGLLFASQSYADLEGYDDYGNATSSFGAGSHLIGLDFNYGFNGILLGGRASWLNHQIADAHSDAFLFDLAGQYAITTNIRYGARIAHLGLASAYQTQDPYLPLEAQTGLSWQQAWHPLISTRLQADLRYRNDEGLAYPLGLALGIGQYLEVRSGYEFKSKYSSPTTGLGLNFAGFSLDYSYVHREFLGGEHRISLSGAL